MNNRLANETSPYLLQHKDNPVDWYPWCQEAFDRAAKEDKPIFLSIGYSACHWCHVFAHESFEDEEIAEILNKYFISVKVDKEETSLNTTDIDLTQLALLQYERLFDETHGGFGLAPKFPTPHNLMFLLDYCERHESPSALNMAERTLLQMYRGGMFDHIGFGFCRYSTDKKFLVPHFEKMLYDNALLILAYCKAYTATKKTLYL